jgi:hypothetical protein
MHDFHGTFRDLLHATNLRHGTDGFTSPPKEGMLRIFSPLKIRWLRLGLNPRTWVLKASTLPLDHRSRCSCVFPSLILHFWSDCQSFVMHSDLLCRVWYGTLYCICAHTRNNGKRMRIRLTLNHTTVKWPNQQREMNRMIQDINCRS